MGDVQVLTDQREVLERKAAEILAEAIKRSVSEKNQAVIAVPGGRSVGAVLERLVREAIDWTRVHIFMVDERLVEPGHPASNFELVRSCLAPWVPEPSLHPFPLGRADHDAAGDAYSRELKSHGGRFDAVLLSAGEDGHVASLFPEHHTIFSDAPLFLTTDSAPKPPPGRMSASSRLIGSSRDGVVLFFGTEKEDALRLFLDESVTVAQCPAKIINTLPRAHVLTDLNRKTP